MPPRRSVAVKAQPTRADYLKEYGLTESYLKDIKVLDYDEALFRIATDHNSMVGWLERRWSFLLQEIQVCADAETNGHGPIVGQTVTYVRPRQIEDDMHEDEDSTTAHISAMKLT
jgi:hypothetical protein